MTSDKFIYIFGRLMPSMSLVLTMILRLVPDYQRKISQIRGARRSIGKGADTGTFMEKAEDGMTIISALTTWALEGGIVTADSMRSRGYGSGKRTSFSVYSFGIRDKVLLAALLALGALIVVAALNGGMQAQFVPHLEITWGGSKWTAAGLAACFIFLSIPTVLNITEGIVWRILRSRI
jgi:energy-coupling factor transport system permease protein